MRACPHTLAHCACAVRAHVAQVVGVFKDWVVIIVSSVVFRSVVQPMQWVGYSVAFVGIALYMRYKYAQHLEKSGSVPVGSQPLLDYSDSDAGSSIGLMSEYDDEHDLEIGEEDGDDSTSIKHEIPGAGEQLGVEATARPEFARPLDLTLPTASPAVGAPVDASHTSPRASPRIPGDAPRLPARATLKPLSRIYGGPRM
jgi:hypothetical protein